LLDDDNASLAAAAAAASGGDDELGSNNSGRYVSLLALTVCVSATCYTPNRDVVTVCVCVCVCVQCVSVKQQHNPEELISQPAGE